jgi:UDP-N-acetylglucosamine 2-epimerase (non-hydrolysing)
MKILSIFGTRPEAIKMAPLIKALERKSGVASLVCITATQRLDCDATLRTSIDALLPRLRLER